MSNENSQDNSGLPDYQIALDYVNRNLEKAIVAMKNSMPDSGAMVKNQIAVIARLRLTEENMNQLITLLRNLADNLRKARAQAYKRPGRKNSKEQADAEPSAETENDESKKSVVYFHNSDFSSLEEYIEHMRKPLFTREDVARADWGKFLDDLNNWKGAA